MGPIGFIVVSLVLAAFSVPLILRKIPMNRLYGARYPLSFKSEKHWYAINRNCGWWLLAAGAVIFAYGVAGFLIPGGGEGYEVVGGILTIVAVLAMALFNYLFARKFDRENG